LLVPVINAVAVVVVKTGSGVERAVAWRWSAAVPKLVDGGKGGGGGGWWCKLRFLIPAFLICSSDGFGARFLFRFLGSCVPEMHRLLVCLFALF
jgi:hypothetical protein